MPRAPEKLRRCAAKGIRHFGPWTVRETRFTHELTAESLTGWLLFRGDGFDAETFFYVQGADLSTETWQPPLDPHATGPADWFPVANGSGKGVSPRQLVALHPMGLPMDIKDNMAVHLKNEFWMESEPEVRMQEWRLAVKQKQYQRLGWPCPKASSKPCTSSRISAWWKPCYRA